MRINRHTRVAAEAVVSAVVLGLLLRWAGLHGVAHTLRGTDLAWFIPAVVLRKSSQACARLCRKSGLSRLSLKTRGRELFLWRIE